MRMASGESGWERSGITRGRSTWRIPTDTSSVRHRPREHIHQGPGIGPLASTSRLKVIVRLAMGTGFLSDVVVSETRFRIQFNRRTPDLRFAYHGLVNGLTDALIELGRTVRDQVRSGFARGPDRMSLPVGQGVSDLQYALDSLGEAGLIEEVERRFDGLPLRLLSEGLSAGGEVISEGTNRQLLVIDPVDGTRGLMHDKRSAFFLAGLAPDGGTPRLRDLTHACLVEIPCTRSDLSDVLAFGEGDGLVGWTENLRTGDRLALDPRPSGADGLEHGFGTLSRFFGGAGGAMGEFQDRFLERLLPGAPDDWMSIFEDQHICNGGQMHALATGRDRFVADLRPLFTRPDGGRLLCAHPYDVLAWPIAEAAGVVLTNPDGTPLDAPLDLETDVAWVGYASEGLRQKVEPALLGALRDVGLLS